MDNLIPPETAHRILERIGRLIVERACNFVPVDEGNLKSSIKYEVEGNSVRIFSDLDYAEDMEWGTPPSILSDSEKENLSDWSERHNVSPKGMINYIQKHGIKVGTAENPMHITSFGRNSYRPFLRPAIFQSQNDITRIIIEELK